MAYNEVLAQRVRKGLAGTKAIDEKQMMGGLCFMVDGKMCVGIVGDDLMVRLDPAEYGQALEEPGCREMDFTGRPMKGFVFVGPNGVGDDADLQGWLDRALRFNPRARPAKKRGPRLP